MIHKVIPRAIMALLIASLWVDTSDAQNSLQDSIPFEEYWQMIGDGPSAFDIDFIPRRTAEIALPRGMEYPVAVIILEPESERDFAALSVFQVVRSFDLNQRILNTEVRLTGDGYGQIRNASGEPVYIDFAKDLSRTQEITYTDVSSSARSQFPNGEAEGGDGAQRAFNSLVELALYDFIVATDRRVDIYERIGARQDFGNHVFYATGRYTPDEPGTIETANNSTKLIGENACGLGNLRLYGIEETSFSASPSGARRNITVDGFALLTTNTRPVRVLARITIQRAATNTAPMEEFRYILDMLSIQEEPCGGGLYVE